MRGGGGVSGDTTVPLRFRAAAGRRYPQNHVGGLELGLDQQCQLPPSDLRGGLGPAQPVVVAGLRHSDQFAHGGDGVIAFFAADEPCGARSPTFSREVGWPGDRGPRAPTEPYVTVSRHTALVVLASPHGTGFGDPGPVHEVARRLLDARVPLPHGSGPAGPQSAVLPPEPPDHVGVDSSQQGVER